MNTINHVEVIVIGAGQAGLAVSYYLNQLQIQHIVLEKNQIGSSWKQQRWDSFKLNTPNWMNLLPGETLAKTTNPHSFINHLEFATNLTQYAYTNQLPILENTEVYCLSQDPDTLLYQVKTKNSDTSKTWYSKQVVIASGVMNRSEIPPLSLSLPNRIQQLHVIDYKNPQQIADKNVLVVGSGQSGCQLAEELSATHNVLLATGKVGRSPRRYRGLDMMDWMNQMGMMNQTTEELRAKGIRPPTQPQVSGVGLYGHTVSLQSLRSDGVTLLGRLTHANHTHFYFDDSVPNHIAFADRYSTELKQKVDDFITTLSIGIQTRSEIDLADQNDNDSRDSTPIRQIPLSDVDSVIWATGFNSDFSWIKLPVLDEYQNPIHDEGVTPLRGIYFIGLPWLRKRKSGIVFGIEEDAAYICQKINSISIEGIL